MSPALLLAALASLAPLAAAAPEAAVAATLARIQALIAAQNGRDAREVAALDRQATQLRAELTPLGWRAAPALGAAARDKARPVKLRLLAASFLGLLRDPAAFGPLEELLLDPALEPDLRAIAAQSLPAQGADAAALRGALCAALAQDGLPREVLEQTLLGLRKLGCTEPSTLERAARRFGPRPAGRELRDAATAIAALGRSPGDAADRALYSLIAYYPPRGEPRASAISALAARPLAAERLKPELLPVVLEALDSESARPAPMLGLIALAAKLGPESGGALQRQLRNPDAELLAAAAEALAAQRRTDALPALESLIAGALEDPRFSPREGRPDPAQLLSRIEASAESLRKLVPERRRPDSGQD